jgi:hypothetical protein
VNTDALMVAFTPAVVFIGSAIAFYSATNSGDGDPSPHVLRGDSIDEPWGIPQHVREHVLPGSVMLVLPRDKGRKHDTRQLVKIIDTEGNEDATTRGRLHDSS